jgi:toxin ParE1/3/4
MTYSLHPQVESDLSAAAEHLAKHASQRTVERFFAEFERVANLLVQHPEIGSPLSRGRRTHPFRVFKYSVVYRIVEGKPRILLVRHQRRRANLGGGRR